MKDVVNIYALVSTRDIEDIRYVGKTVTSGNTRLYEHRRRCFIDDTYKDRWMRKEINTGYSIEMIILDIVPITEWEYWEKYYISLYKERGYKLTNTDPGGNKTKEISPNQVKTVVLDINGKYLGVYNTIADAARSYNIAENKAAGVVSSNNLSARGYIFVKESDYSKNKNYAVDTTKRKGKPILQYSLDGKLINNWDKILDAVEYYGVKKSVLTACAKGQQLTSCGYIWQYTDNKEELQNRLDKLNFNNIKDSVNVYYKDSGELVGIYKNKQDACRQLNINSKQFSKGISKRGFYKNYTLDNPRNYLSV